MVKRKEKCFRDYLSDAVNWITLANGEFYPDILPNACELYKPVLVLFGQYVRASESSPALFRRICEIRQAWMRIQLARVFRKYVCPSLSVEMLKKKSDVDIICSRFNREFRPIQQVQEAFSSRPLPDEALCVLLWEDKDRGKKGYDLTERFFAMVHDQLPDYIIDGPIRSGRDIRMGSVWPDFSNPDRPADFVIRKAGRVLAVGFARYDGDRGGAQEDDRTGGYRHCASEFLAYTRKRGLSGVKLIFLNDGPGLLLGSMWSDYSSLEDFGRGRIRVATLRMVSERITRDWLEG